MFPKFTTPTRFALSMLVGAIFMIQCAKTVPQAVMPKTIAGDMLTSVIAGAEAEKIMTDMHGKALGTTQYEIGYYGATDNKDILYLSIFQDEQTAKQDYMNMSMKMSNGTEVFERLSVDHKEGQVRFTTTGMGKMHFIFRDKNVLIWWQGDSTKMDSAKADLEKFTFSNR